MISEVVKADVQHHQAVFMSARPFRHVVIDDFLETENAERLLDDFPSFGTEEIDNEGGRAIDGNLAGISDFYATFEQYVMRTEFLNLISRITGIEDLLPDERRFGGGTLESFQGQEEDPHLDSNYDEQRWVHRRLNLILYLSKEWDEAWGGLLELHSNPRRPDENEIKAILPLFNRCVIFETREHSWHGFTRIQLPADKQNVSRRSISITLYSKERAAEEIVPPHGTFWVQRPLPKHIRTGHLLSEDDVEDIQRLIVKRDRWLEHYHHQELDHSREIKALRGYVHELESKSRLPLTGYVLQRGLIQGYWADGCVAKYLRTELVAIKDASHILLFGYVPSYFPAKNLIIIQAGTFKDVRFIPNTGNFEVQFPVEIKGGSTIDFSIQATESMSGQRAGLNQDTREAAFLVTEIRFE
jgi:2OG-Fe(II) oxygenase superfamily